VSDFVIRTCPAGSEFVNVVSNFVIPNLPCRRAGEGPYVRSCESAAERDCVTRMRYRLSRFSSSQTRMPYGPMKLAPVILLGMTRYFFSL
jgi:hypothetical protein